MTRGRCLEACPPHPQAAWSKVGLASHPASTLSLLGSRGQPWQAIWQASTCVLTLGCCCASLPCAGFGRKSAEATGMMEGDRAYQASPALASWAWHFGRPACEPATNSGLRAAAAVAAVARRPAPQQQVVCPRCRQAQPGASNHPLLSLLCSALGGWCLQGIFPTKKITTALEGVLPAAQASLVIRPCCCAGLLAGQHSCTLADAPCCWQRLCTELQNLGRTGCALLLPTARTIHATYAGGAPVQGS